jgi:hypothetical protein
MRDACKHASRQESFVRQAALLFHGLCLCIALALVGPLRVYCVYALIVQAFTNTLRTVLR